MGATSLTAVCGWMQGLCLSWSISKLGLCQLVSVGSRPILGLHFRVRWMLRPLLNPLRVCDCACDCTAEWMPRWMSMGLKASMDKCIRLQCVWEADGLGFWAQAFQDKSDRSQSEDACATTRLVQMGTLELSAVCGPVQWLSTTCCASQKQLCKLVQVGSILFLAVHTRLQRVHWTGRSHSWCSNWMPELVPVGTNAILAADTRLFSMQCATHSSGPQPHPRRQHFQHLQHFYLQHLQCLQRLLQLHSNFAIDTLWHHLPWCDLVKRSLNIWGNPYVYRAFQEDWRFCLGDSECSLYRPALALSRNKALSTKTKPEFFSSFWIFWSCGSVLGLLNMYVWTCVQCTFRTNGNYVKLVTANIGAVIMFLGRKDVPNIRILPKSIQKLRMDILQGPFRVPGRTTVGM